MWSQTNHLLVSRQSLKTYINNSTTFPSKTQNRNPTRSPPTLAPFHGGRARAPPPERPAASPSRRPVRGRTSVVRELRARARASARSRRSRPEDRRRWRRRRRRGRRRGEAPPLRCGRPAPAEEDIRSGAGVGGGERRFGVSGECRRFSGFFEAVAARVVFNFFRLGLF